MTDMPEKILVRRQSKNWLHGTDVNADILVSGTEYIRADLVAKEINDKKHQTVKMVCELYKLDVYQTMIDLDWKVTKDFEE